MVFWWVSGPISQATPDNQTVLQCAQTVHNNACTHVLHLSHESDRQTYALSTFRVTDQCEQVQRTFLVCTFSCACHQLAHKLLGCFHRAALPPRAEKHCCYSRRMFWSTEPCISSCCLQLFLCQSEAQTATMHRGAGCSPGHIAENIAAAA